MNITKTTMTFLLLFTFFTIAPATQQNVSKEDQARQIVQAFMDSKGMNIKPGTDEYKILMRRIFWDEYPELTGTGSTFISNQE